ncbi:NmrA-like family domain-containing protein 1 [Fusarium austroafricanum]|uniref:NmrA-like family domain-containing protein 1 n=1 Tax=Fusarium austroafricanum TaxID=2364996 RepID=A0A8H4KMU3_9HYPO|nr:NmrA-like family domain-containing protein 1 [Fusarium austroafricanum]
MGDRGNQRLQPPVLTVPACPEITYSEDRDKTGISSKNNITLNSKLSLYQLIIMSSTKLITVFGATGSQGGSVVESLIQNKALSFKVKGITRNPDSEKAKTLAGYGVEVVKADGLVKEEVIEAFRGSWGVFVNTNSDDPSMNQKDGPTELDVGKVIVDAAAEAGVRHFVYSGMASASKTTGGAVPNQAFDMKHAVGKYAESKGAFETVNIVSPGWYQENHLVEEFAPALGGFPFAADEEGYLTLHVPRWGGNEEIPFISIGDDYGDLVHGIFLDPAKYSGRLVQAISASETTDKLVSEFEKVTGKKARFVPIEDWKTMETYGDPSFETVKYMFGFCQHSGGLYYGVPNDLGPAAELKAKAAEAKGDSSAGKLMTLETFWKKHFAS